MDKRLIDLAAVPTAIAASAVGARRHTSPPSVRDRAVARARAAWPEWASRPDLASIARPVVVNKLRADELARLMRPNRSRSKLASFLPIGSQPSRREQSLKLARSLGMAAGAAIFTVEFVSGVKRAVGGDGSSTAQAEAAESQESARETPRPRKATGSAKTPPAKKLAVSR